MTYDDGIMRLYETVNIAPPGNKPTDGLKIKDQYYYSYDNLGINRYYTAMANNQQIECVINVPDWPSVHATDIVVLENQSQYRI